MSHLSLLALLRCASRAPIAASQPLRSFHSQPPLQLSVGERHRPEPPFDPSKPYVTLPALQEEPVRRNVLISFPKKSSEITEALTALLNVKYSEITSFGNPGWKLDKSYDAINRFMALATETEAKQLERDINAAANEMDHHPQIHTRAANPRLGNVWCVLATCNTHDPPGLSMRDVRLARKIDEIASGYQVMAPANNIGPDRKGTGAIHRERERMAQFHRTARTGLGRRASKSATLHARIMEASQT